MKRSTLIGTVMMLSLGLFANQTMAEQVHSLRGENPLNTQSKAPKSMKWQDDREPISRDYVSQWIQNKLARLV